MILLPPREFVLSPEAAAARYTTAEAEAYTRWLATHHYENFHVVSFLLPKRLHQDFYNVYAYCRWADDLGDEMGSPAESLRLLAWWREQLEAMYAGEAAHPVFVALRGTVDATFNPARAVRRSDPRLRTGSDRHAVRRVGGRLRVLPLFGQPGGPPGALPVRLLRRRTPAAVRRHLHRAAARQLLAGRDRRSGERTASISRSKCSRGTVMRSRICMRGA